MKTRKSNMAMTTFVAKSSTEREQQRLITRGEVMMCEVISEVNLPISATDVLNKAVKNYVSGCRNYSISQGQFLQ